MDMSLNKLLELVIDRESLVRCSLWGRKESDMTEPLNWTEKANIVISSRKPTQVSGVQIQTK